MNIEITNLTNHTCDEARLASVAEFAMVSMGLHRDCEVSISLVDEDEMSALHVRWMDEPGATDVLSFPMDEIKPNSAPMGPGMLGDIILCPAFAARQAEEAGHPLQDELELLTVHGALHLLGYDHRDEDEKEIMFGIQERYLRDWKVSR
jgi:probable rRNA maturation factor